MKLSSLFARLTAVLMFLLPTLCFAQTEQEIVDSANAAFRSPTGDHLQALLNSLGYTIDVHNDELDQELFCASESMAIKILSKRTAYSTKASFGYYAEGDTSSTVRFGGSETQLNDSFDVAIATESLFGFYLRPAVISNSDFWYSESALNADGIDHVWMYATGIPGEYIIAFEDVAGGGDMDFDDLVLKVGFTDLDNDHLLSGCDNCPNIANADQQDSDGDGVGDACDNCPEYFNPDQEDADHDGIGNHCELPFEPNEPFQADMIYVQSADLDFDNRVDIVYTGSLSDSLFISFGMAGGGFESPLGMLKISNAPVVIAHLNGDTLLDIAVSGPTMLYRLMNQSNRQFDIDSVPLGAPLLRPNSVESFGSTITYGYFDADTYADLVVGPGFLLHGAAGNSLMLSEPLPFSFTAVDAADLNGDNTDDLVTLSGSNLEMRVNSGTGSFSLTQTIPLTGEFSGGFVQSNVDFNNDGKSDIAVVTALQDSLNSTSHLTLVLGAGDGTALSTQSLDINGMAASLAVTDIDRDQDLDISVVNSRTAGLDVFLNDGAGQFAFTATIPLSNQQQAFQALAAGDFDRDGNPDFVTGGTNSPVVLALNGLPDFAVLADEMVTTALGDVDVKIINPDGFVISHNLQTVAGSAAWRLDVNQDGKLDERLFDYNLEYGEYKLIIKPVEGDDGGSSAFTQDIRIDGTQQIKLFQDYAGGSTSAGRRDPNAVDSIVFYYTVEPVSSIWPPNGVAVKKTLPEIEWNLLAGLGAQPLYYQFQLDRYHDFRAPIFDTTGMTTPDYIVQQPLGKDSVYYWRVRGFDGTAWSEYSRTFALYIVGTCCVGSMGNVDGVGGVDLSDLSNLIAYMTNPGGITLVCPEAAGLSKSRRIDLIDLSTLIAYLTLGRNNVQLPLCP